jgi:hypothetical protein
VFSGVRPNNWPGTVAGHPRWMTLIWTAFGYVCPKKERAVNRIISTAFSSDWKKLLIYQCLAFCPPHILTFSSTQKNRIAQGLFSTRQFGSLFSLMSLWEYKGVGVRPFTPLLHHSSSIISYGCTSNLMASALTYPLASSLSTMEPDVPAANG